MRFDNELTDDAVLAELGARVAQLRLDRNLTQHQLADEAGVGRSTVARVEAGSSVTLSALLRVLRALELLENLEALVPRPLPSPIEALERENSRRQRARGPRSAEEDSSEPWHWGTT